MTKQYAPVYKTVTIADSATVSGAADLGKATLLGVQLPSTFDGTTLTFQVSADGSTYTALVDTTGTAVGMTGLAASKAFSIDPALFFGWRYVKLVAGAQTGDTIITLVSRIVE